MKTSFLKAKLSLFLKIGVYRVEDIFTFCLLLFIFLLLSLFSRFLILILKLVLFINIIFLHPFPFHIIFDSIKQYLFFMKIIKINRHLTQPIHPFQENRSTISFVKSIKEKARNIDVPYASKQLLFLIREFHYHFY